MAASGATQPPGSRNDEFRLQLGLFVLGALPLDEHLDVEQHLTECAECRAECDELSDVPAMLSSLSTEDMRALADEFAPERRERRTWLSRADRLRARMSVPALRGVRPRVLAAAAAITLILGVGIGAWVQSSSGGSGSGTTLTVAATSRSSGARASIVVTGRGDGSHVEATVSGLDRGQRYELLSVAADGKTTVAARWTGSDDVMVVVADVPVPPRELAFFTVAKLDGSVVLTVRVRSR
jgi:anti-sigma factor RsiW